MTFDATLRAWNEAAVRDDARAAIHPTGVDDAQYSTSGHVEAARLSAIFDDDVRYVLDFGCGDGRVAVPLMARYDVMCVDSSHAMLVRLAVNASAAGVTHQTEWLLSDGTDLATTLDGVLAHPIDAVYALAVLIHHRHDDTAQIIGQLAQVVRPRGQVILDLPLYAVAHEPEAWNDVARWTLAEFADVALDAGLAIEKARQVDGPFDHANPGRHDLVVCRRIG